MPFRFPGRWRDADPGPNPLFAALERRRALHPPILDLTLSNPTRAGLAFPAGWPSLLADPDVREYHPDPAGSPAARAAIAEYYAGRDGGLGTAPDPGDFFLTAGTSEAYSHLFKLLCGPGDEAVVPRPSYPLLDTLAELEGIRLRSCDLRPATTDPSGWTWRIDRDSLEAALTERTRILFLVQPNNPTGSVLDPREAAWLLELAARRNLALVADEVFADYPHGGNRAVRLRSEGPLVFTLNGLSKLLGLPQLKLAWIHVEGNPADKTRAKRHLEWLCDAWLSVGAAPQAACGSLLRRRGEFQEPIRERLRTNLAALREAAAREPRLCPQWPQGGWCVPLRCAGIADDEAFVIRLLETEGVLVQPGYFFDFGNEETVVASLLPEPGVFREGLERLSRALRW